MNRFRHRVLLGWACLLMQWAGAQSTSLKFNFFGENVVLPYPKTAQPAGKTACTEAEVNSFHILAQQSPSMDSLCTALQSYRTTFQLDDWLHYQLIRKTAQAICPKQADYYRYTLIKWYLLCRTGYDAAIRIAKNKMLLYVRCSENVYNIPSLMQQGKQYICLNYHDYGSNINFLSEDFSTVIINLPGAERSFSYQITALPSCKPAGGFIEKEIHFLYRDQEYRFQVRLNPDIKNIFVNYPVLDYAAYFNTPLSQTAYQSLIPQLKQQVLSMSQQDGIDYLMHFTRDAFVFKTDTEVFGGEKRLTPELTLLYDYSDCEDRAALFFALVKEIYNLPMLVLAYPEHVTMAVKLNRPQGRQIMYNGMAFSVCEPTPQRNDLSIGQLPRGLKKASYEVAYAYLPMQ
jgi:hypothetical protein